jgi:alanine racemase
MQFLEIHKISLDIIYSMSTDHAPSPVCARVSLGAFQHNLNAVRSYVGNDVRVMAVIKADGYGHGMTRLARAAEESGITDFGVARVHEGIELRQHQPSATILVFEAGRGDTLNAAIMNRLDLTTVSEETTCSLESAARAVGIRARIHVKVDTGMGRLGLPPASALHVVEQVSRSQWLTLAGIYSHFATSEDPDQAFAREQLSRFQDLLDAVTGQGIHVPLRHMANSGAIISLPESHFDLVRPGIMLYGYPPGFGMPERYPVVPVLSLTSRVAFLKTVSPGTSISYGRRYFTKETTRIATVPMGYADGYPRALLGKASALVNGVRYPVVGTICMDQLMLDLGPDSTAQVGDEVVLIGRSEGEQITAWDIARSVGSIPYEITCVITRRVPREYVP